MKLSSLPQRIPALVLLVALLLGGCGGGARPTAVPPAGASSGLNTFIYVYSDT